jgi:hypothetical protein
MKTHKCEHTVCIWRIFNFVQEKMAEARDKASNQMENYRNNNIVSFLYLIFSRQVVSGLLYFSTNREFF